MNILHIDNINSLAEKVDRKMEKLEIGMAIEEIFEVLRKNNKYIDDTTPWVLAKDESQKDSLCQVIYNLLESIRVCGIMLSSFLPDTSDKIMEQLNNCKKETLYLNDNVYNVGIAQPLFQRIDKDQKMLEIENM